MAFPREEVRATIERYHEVRRRIDDGLEPDAFGALADFYTDDAVYVDGAWGRLEGKDTIARWLVDSMLGMEDWKFPIEFTAIEGDDVVVKWTQVMPGPRLTAPRIASPATRDWSTPATASSPTRRTRTTWPTCSRTCEASGWQPRGGEMNFPPAHPDRNFDIPGAPPSW